LGAKNYPLIVILSNYFNGRAVGIDFSWRCELNPQGGWTTLDYNDSRWRQDVSLLKGPPELEVVPFVMPDPYVGLQSQVDGVRVVRNDRRPGDLLVIRKVFEIK
jgi:hypothetical protein